MATTVIFPHKDVEEAVRELKHPDPEVRSMRVDYIGLIGDPKALKPLLDQFGEEKNERVKCRIADAIGRMQDERALDKLKESFNKESSIVQGRIIKAFEDIGGYKARELLTEILNDQNVSKDAQIRAGRAIESMNRNMEAEFDSQVSKKPAEETKELESMLRIFGEVKEPRVKSLIIVILGEKRDERAVEPLIKDFRTEDNVSLQTDIVKSLGRISGREAFEFINHVIEHPEEIGSRGTERERDEFLREARQAIENMREIMRNEFGVYREKPKDPYAGVAVERVSRYITKYDMTVLNSNKDIKALVWFLNDGNAEVRNEAVWYLGNRRDPGTVDALMEHFKKEENLAVKRQIIDALEKICNLDGHNIRYHDLGFVEKPKVLEILRFLENVFGGSEEDEIVREKAKDAFNTIERTNFR